MYMRARNKRAFNHLHSLSGGIASVIRHLSHAALLLGVLSANFSYAELGKSYRDAERLSVGEKLNISEVSGID